MVSPIDRCNYRGCPSTPTYFVLWSGREDLRVCNAHANMLMIIAAAMGCPLDPSHLKPLHTLSPATPPPTNVSVSVDPSNEALSLLQHVAIRWLPVHRKDPLAIAILQYINKVGQPK